MKYTIPILTILLVLYGLLIFFSTLLATGIGFYTPILTISAFIGFIVLLFNKKIGWTIMLIVSSGWLLRYFEHVSYLILYDPNSFGRWLLTLIPIILAFPIFGLTLREKLQKNGLSFKKWYWEISLIVFLSIGVLSFIYKPHTKEFNCWYYFDNNDETYKIRFAVTPQHIFEATTNSKELKHIIKHNAITYEYREGYYCPETKVRIFSSFKRIVGIKILGFRNTEIDQLVKFDNPYKIDVTTIKGDKSILQPEFNLGD